MLSRLLKSVNILKIIKREDKYILATVFIAGIINNFYFLISDGLSPDALSSEYTHIAGLWETQLGRFSLQFLDSLRYGFVNQLLIILISLCFIAGAMMLIRRTFKIKSTSILVILTILITVAPQFTETYMYLYCADSYLFAFFLAVLAVFSMSKIDKLLTSKRWAISVVLATALLCSLYQSYLGVLLGLVVTLAIFEIIKNDSKTAIKHFLRNLILVGIGIVGYYVLFRIICKLEHTRPSAYKGANSLGLTTILALPETITSAFADFYYFFFGQGFIINNNFYGRQVIYSILAVLILLGVFQIFKSVKQERIIKIVIFLVLLIIFPIAANIMNLIAPGTRINLVTGPGIITTAVLAAVILDSLNRQSILRFCSNAVLVFLAWTFLLSNVATYVVREREYSDFKGITENIYTRATLADGYSTNMPFMFSYLIETPSSEVERTNGMVTRDNISWTAYAGVQRYTIFIERFLGHSVEPANEENYAKIVKTDDFKNMPIYPNDGSIKIIDNVVVIKTSDKTYLNEDGTVKLW